MAAVAYPMPDPWGAPRSGHPDSAGCGGRHDARLYRRRRAVALLALVVVALVAAIAVLPALGGSDGGALTTTGSSGAGTDAGPSTARPAIARAATGHVYLVQPGDSIWSIVQASGHRGDVRPLVDRIAIQLNGRPLHPGQRLLIP